MSLHKFAIGQTVDFNRQLPSISRPRGPFEVVSMLPVDEGNSPTYHIKSVAESFARVAKEADLVAVGPAPDKQSSASLWAEAASVRRRTAPPRSR